MVEDACIAYGFSLSTIFLESVFDIDLDLVNGPPGDLDADIYKFAGSQLDPKPHVIPVPDFALKSDRLIKLLSTLDAGFAADLCFFLKKWLIADFCLKHSFKRVLLGTSGHKVSS